MPKKMSMKEKIERMRREKLKERIQSGMTEEEEKAIDGWQSLGSADVQDGDYVYTPHFKGVLHLKQQQIELDFTDSENEDLGQWTNTHLRSKLAVSSLLKIRDRKGKTLLNNQSMHEVGQHVKERGVNAIFINTTLTTVQTKNLEKIFGAMANGTSLKEVFKSRNPFYNTDYDTAL